MLAKVPSIIYCECMQARQPAPLRVGRASAQQGASSLTPSSSMPRTSGGWRSWLRRPQAQRHQQRRKPGSLGREMRVLSTHSPGRTCQRCCRCLSGFGCVTAQHHEQV